MLVTSVSFRSQQTMFHVWITTMYAAPVKQVVANAYVLSYVQVVILQSEH